MAIQDCNDIINRASRRELEAVLSGFCFAVYDHESAEDLREAVRANVEDGTIDADTLSFIVEEVRT